MNTIKNVNENKEMDHFADAWYVYNGPCAECYNALQTGLGLNRYVKFFQPRLYDLELDAFFKAFGLIGVDVKNMCKESIMEAKELLKKLSQERAALIEECEQLTKERFILEEKYSINRQMKELKQQKKEKLDEKIECIKKEIYPIKVFRVRPMSEDLLYIELRSENGFRKVGTLSFNDEIVKEKLDIEKHKFCRAFISVCHTKIFWEWEHEFIDAEDLVACLK